ncbi:MAG: hypothetical protein D6737_02965 [Chloroflexi bacterium]|nr:MAG: hypothetical protein D6737_02965 [Chloroflexota bacterium]
MAACGGNDATPAALPTLAEQQSDEGAGPTLPPEQTVEPGELPTRPPIVPTVEEEVPINETPPTQDPTVPAQLTALANAAATATTIVELDTGENPPTIEGQEAVSTAVFGEGVPLPGTIVAPATEDAAPGLLFDSLIYTQSGGPGDTELTVELHSDGTLIRDGETFTVSPEVVAEIDQLLDDIGFFGLSGTFTSPARGSDTYIYALRVEQGGLSRAIRGQDGLLPPELQNLFVRLSQLGLDVPQRGGG